MKSNDRSARFQDILDLARMVGSTLNTDQIIQTSLNHLCQRMGKRARCAFLEGNELKLRFWAGTYNHAGPMDAVPVNKESVVWEVVQRGAPVNLTDPCQTAGYTHTLQEQVKLKAVIPLQYADPLTREMKKVGALIVDSGKQGPPLSEEDFEYLIVIGELIGAVAGRADLVQRLMDSCQRQQAIVRETAHNFRNRIAAIGGFSARIARLAKETDLADSAQHLHEEVLVLQAHLEEFERFMSG